MKVLTFAFLIALTSALVAPAFADAPWSMQHNGSRMKLFWNKGPGTTFKIVYVRPRPGLAVNPGTILIKGTVLDDSGSVTATAYTFKEGCRPAGYEVSGSIDGDSISFTGRAPVRQGCKVVGYAPTNNSSLVFTREFE